MKKLFQLLIPVLTLYACQNKPEKEETVPVNNTVETPVNVEEPSTTSKKDSIPFDIVGTYIYENKVAQCKIELTLFYKNQQLHYKMQTNARTLASTAEVMQEDDRYYVIFKNIKWSENLGYIDPERNAPAKNLPLPTEIMASFKKDEITFQNYGNAENYYMILKECDTKFIQLEKLDTALGEDIAAFNAYTKNIYTKNGKIYIDLDFVEIRYPQEGEGDVSDRKIVNKNTKIRTYSFDENTAILSNNCKEFSPTELWENRKAVLMRPEIITIGSAKNGKIVQINFGCYE